MGEYKALKQQEIIDTTGYRMPLNLFELKRLFYAVQLKYAYYDDRLEYVLYLKDGRMFYIDEDLFNIVSKWERAEDGKFKK